MREYPDQSRQSACGSRIGGRVIAFAFDRIKDLVEPKTDGNGNIFGADQQTSQAEGGVTPGQPTAKTSTEGEGAVSSGPSTTVAPQQQPQATQQTAGAQQQALTNQAAKAKAPKIAQDLYGQLDTAGKSSEDEAKAWLNNAQQTNYNVAPEQLEKAVTGDAASRKAYTDLIGKTAATEKASPFVSKVDTNVQGIQDIQTDEGLRRMLAREAGPQYTAGEGAYDMMLLNRNQDFANTRKDLAARQSALSALAGKRGQDFQTIADTSRGADLIGAQARAKGYLSDQEKALDTRYGDAAKAYNQQLATYRADPKSLYGTQAKAAQDEALAQLATQGMLPGDVGSVNAGDYYKVRGDIGDRDLYNEADAKRFNDIETLLGGGQTRSAGTVGDVGTFDKPGYENALLGLGTRPPAQIAATGAPPPAATPPVAPETTDTPPGAVPPGGGNGSNDPFLPAEQGAENLGHKVNAFTGNPILKTQEAIAKAGGDTADVAQHAGGVGSDINKQFVADAKTAGGGLADVGKSIATDVGGKVSDIGKAAVNAPTNAFNGIANAVSQPLPGGGVQASASKADKEVADKAQTLANGAVKVAQEKAKAAADAKKKAEDAFRKANPYGGGVGGYLKTPLGQAAQAAEQASFTAAAAAKKAQEEAQKAADKIKAGAEKASNIAANTVGAAGTNAYNVATGKKKLF